MKTKRFGKSPFCFLSLGSEGRWRNNCSVQIKTMPLSLRKISPEAAWTEEAHAYFSKALATAMSKYSLLCLCSAQDTSMASNPKGGYKTDEPNEEAISAKWIIRTTERAILSRRHFFDFRPVGRQLGVRENAPVFTSRRKFKNKKIFLKFLSEKCTMILHLSVFSKGLSRKVRGT